MKEEAGSERKLSGSAVLEDAVHVLPSDAAILPLLRQPLNIRLDGANREDRKYKA